MEVNLYLESTIKSPRESEGIIGFVIEVQTKGEPATKSQFYRVNATKNQSQLMILNIALSHLKKMPFALSIYADFRYLESAFSHGWIDEWEKNGWKNAKNEPVGNAAMWQETLILLNGNEVSWHVGEEHSYKKWMISQMKEE
nr:MAG TPA: ribonuclease HI [Caudoviricetes sp.]